MQVVVEGVGGTGVVEAEVAEEGVAVTSSLRCGLTQERKALERTRR